MAEREGFELRRLGFDFPTSFNSRSEKRHTRSHAIEIPPF